ncbi:MAG: hypothetical protein ACYTHJ_16820 [Planctomycetota bacterium]|jgi:hypothetical protein
MNSSQKTRIVRFPQWLALSAALLPVPFTFLSIVLVVWLLGELIHPAGGELHHMILTAIIVPGQFLGCILPATWTYKKLRWKSVPFVACGRCSYDLTGNASGVCPECGCATESLGKGECKMDP